MATGRQPWRALQCPIRSWTLMFQGFAPTSEEADAYSTVQVPPALVYLNLWRCVCGNNLPSAPELLCPLMLWLSVQVQRLVEELAHPQDAESVQQARLPFM